jgi:Predicted hydrolases or acyltransferases (alpha/beta hydrolase superfamily)
MQDTETISVIAPDGGQTLAEVAGPQDPSGLGVILIHGVLHSRLIWKRQFADPTLAGLRRLAYDVRGHGDATKPVDRASYDAPRYADELDAVIRASGIARPILVGWSLGSRVMFSYVEKYGTARLGGMMIVGARMKTLDNPGPSAAADAMVAALSRDLNTRIPGRRDFVSLCHEVPLAPADLFEMTAAAMAIPPEVLASLSGRPLDVVSLMAGLDIPVRIVQGDCDQVNDPAFAHEALRINPRARLSVYEGVGHTPFFEAPARFGGELLDFVAECRAAGGVAAGV